MDRRTVLCASALLGCTQLNPAFEGSGDSQADADSETVAEAGEAELGDGDGEPPGDGDGEPHGDGDGDPSGDGDGDGDPGDGDGDPQACTFTPRASRVFSVKTNNGCPGDLDFYAPITWSNVTSPIIEEVPMCGPGCDGCGLPVAFGVADYDLFEELMAFALPATLSESSCLHIQTAAFNGEDVNGCNYKSASIALAADNTTTPVFVLNRDQAPLTLDAQGLLANHVGPEPGEIAGTCHCAGVWGTKLDEVMCCQGANAIPTGYDFDFDGVAYTTGTDYTINMNGSSWVFHAIQAQVIPGCMTGAPESNWTLLKI